MGKGLGKGVVSCPSTGKDVRRTERGLIIRQIRYHLSILRIDMAAGNISDEVIMIVHNRKLMRMILVECLYNILHRITKTELRWRVAHQL